MRHSMAIGMVAWREAWQTGRTDGRPKRLARVVAAGPRDAPSEPIAADAERLRRRENGARGDANSCLQEESDI